MSLLFLFLSSFIVPSLDPVAVAITNVITNLTTEPTMKSLKWDPGMAGIDILPAGIVGMPKIERIEPDEREDHLGSTDWRLEYPVALVFDLSEATYSQDQAIACVEAFIDAIDDDGTLENHVADSKVTFAEPTIVDDERRASIVYRCTVRCLKFVPHQQ